MNVVATRTSAKFAPSSVSAIPSTLVPPTSNPIPMAIAGEANRTSRSVGLRPPAGPPDGLGTAYAVRDRQRPLRGDLGGRAHTVVCDLRPGADRGAVFSFDGREELLAGMAAAFPD